MQSEPGSAGTTINPSKMNFAKAQDLTDPFPKVMKDGDLVIAYERHDSMDHFYLAAGKILNNKFGSFYHNDFLG